LLIAAIKEESKYFIYKVSTKEYYKKEINCIVKIYKKVKAFSNLRNLFAIKYESFLQKLDQQQ